MLRISTEPEGDTQTQDPNVSALTSGSPTPPTVDPSAATGMTPHENPVAGKNHAALLIPWISNEMRFHSVLDMACGSGEAVSLLGEHGYDSWGVDLDPGIAGDTVMQGDLFSVPKEDGYFDLVICANTAQEIEDHRIASMLAEMNRLSNSYILISAPGPEAEEGTPGRIRDASWWCQRIADFDWRVRLLREEPETGQLVLLAEKADSLAAKVLPLLDEGVEVGNPQAEETTPSRPELSEETQAALSNSLTLLTSALENFAAGKIDAGYLSISDMAHALAPVGSSVEGLFEALGDLVAAMEKRDEEGTIHHLAHGILPLLQSALGS
jgi:SAM-dependent methyltransferase